MSYLLTPPSSTLTNPVQSVLWRGWLDLWVLNVTEGTENRVRVRGLYMKALSRRIRRRVRSDSSDEDVRQVEEGGREERRDAKEAGERLCTVRGV